MSYKQFIIETGQKGRYTAWLFNRKLKRKVVAKPSQTTGEKDGR